MRTLLLLVLLAVVLIGFRHSKTDFEVAMRRFVNFYNAGDGTGIGNLFSDDWGKRKYQFYSKERLQQLKADYGNIVSYTYVTIDSVSDDNRITLFKVVAERKTFMTGFTLNEKKQFGTFRLNTSSPYIDSLLQVF